MKAPRKPPTSLQIAKRFRAIAEDKKATDPVILDLSEVSSLADYFVICSANNEPQLKAIVNEVRKVMKEEYGRLPLAVDGFPASQWIVADYGDVICHVFHHDKRSHYALEELWGDCPRVK